MTADSKAILVAYRDLAAIAKSSDAWNPASLSESLTAAATTLQSARGPDAPSIEVRVPHVIEGYANSDVIAILLPVIENAIEAARPATVVTIAYSLLDDGEHRLRVSGESMNEPGSDRIYEAGFTTKDGHEGLGLAAARSLADRFSRRRLDSRLHRHEGPLRPGTESSS